LFTMLIQVSMHYYTCLILLVWRSTHVMCPSPCSKQSVKKIMYKGCWKLFNKLSLITHLRPTRNLPPTVGSNFQRWLLINVWCDITRHQIIRPRIFSVHLTQDICITSLYSKYHASLRIWCSCTESVNHTWWITVWHLSVCPQAQWCMAM
jgi:hypothetical protein